MGDTGDNNGGGGLFARIANSAEYSIAAALLAVCVVVGGALWLLQPEDGEVVVAPAPTPAAQVAIVDEDAALSDWKRRLGEQFSEAEDQQRERAAQEEQARRARTQAQEEVAAARRQAEAERQAQQRLEAAVAERQATPVPTISAPTSAPQRSIPAPRSTPRVTVTPTVAPQPALVAAAIDWSSCELPSYPALSVRRGEEGTVVIAADLDADARLLEARVSESSGHSKLDRATLDAVRECRFTPALENGVARAATAEVRFTWRLN